MIRRRDFITLLGSAAAVWPVAARAQQGNRVIGVLMGVAADEDGDARIAALREGLRQLGWIEGRNLQMEVRLSAGDASRMRANAVEVVAMSPDLIVATNVAIINAVRQANSSIPVVFALVANVVESGLVASQARPGGNVTGFTNFEPRLRASGLRC